MANTADRRSEGRVYSTNPEAVAARLRYHERKAQGLCPRTGTPVVNRTYSYDAQDKINSGQVDTYTRRFCRENGITVDLLKSIDDKRLKPLLKLLKGARKRAATAPSFYHRKAA